MKKLIFLLLLVVQTALAQSNLLNGNLGAAGSTCSTTAPFNCLVMQLPPGSQTVGVVITGTWTATQQFEKSNDNGTTWVVANAVPIPLGVSVTSTTANGTWDIATSGATHIRVRTSAFTSGTANVNLASSLAELFFPSSVTPASFFPAPAQSSGSSTQTPITASNTGAAGAITATLSGVASKTTYITGFQVTGGGATGASIITVTVTGTISGTMSYNIGVPAGATAGAPNLIVSFPVPVPASAVNTSIVVNVPSFGAGNTNSAVAAQGFQQ